MGQVYHLATRNLIWAGEDEGGRSKEAIESLHNVLQDMRSATNDYTTVYPTLFNESFRPQFSNADISILTLSHLDGYTQNAGSLGYGWCKWRNWPSILPATLGSMNCL
jgi:hypothetical protein